MQYWIELRCCNFRTIQSTQDLTQMVKMMRQMLERPQILQLTSEGTFLTTISEWYAHILGHTPKLVFLSFWRIHLSLFQSWKGLEEKDTFKTKVDRGKVCHIQPYLNLFVQSEQHIVYCTLYIEHKTAPPKGLLPSISISIYSPLQSMTSTRGPLGFQADLANPLFSYASSSTLYPCQWVSEWVGHSFGLA